MKRKQTVSIVALTLLGLVPLTMIGITGCSDRERITAEPSLWVASPVGLSKEDGEEGDWNDNATRTYEVTIENLTTGQPFSPGVVATHTKMVRVFQVGAYASEGVRLIAEEGDPTVAQAALAHQEGIFEVIATSAPVHRIGGPGSNSLTLRINARSNANRLSLATMIICTNDGFTGLDGVKLPGGFKPKVFYSAAYDAGTESNDELSTSIVDPCGAIGPVSMPPDGDHRTTTHDVIMHHPGIQGGHSLNPTLHGWENPVARITVQRVK